MSAEGKAFVSSADTYAKEATEQFCSRVPLHEIQRELLQAMFALAWQTGYAEGGKTMAAMIQQEWNSALKGVDQR